MQVMINTYGKMEMNEYLRELQCENKIYGNKNKNGLVYVEVNKKSKAEGKIGKREKRKPAHY